MELFFTITLVVGILLWCATIGGLIAVVLFLMLEVIFKSIKKGGVKWINFSR